MSARFSVPLSSVFASLIASFHLLIVVPASELVSLFSYFPFDSNIAVSVVLADKLLCFLVFPLRPAVVTQEYLERSDITNATKFEVVEVNLTKSLISSSY